MDLLQHLGSLANNFDTRTLPPPAWLASVLNRNFLRLATFYTFSALPLLFVLAALTLVLLPTSRDVIPAPTGCRRIGLKTGSSNLTDEHKPNPTDSQPASTPHKLNGPFRVKSLWIYPIKSCRGIELSTSSIHATGLQYDRQFSLAQHIPPKSGDEGDGEWRFITQREYSLLNQVRTELWIPDPSLPLYKPTAPYVLTGGAIILTFPDPCVGVAGFLRRTLHNLLGASETPEKSAIIPFAPASTQNSPARYQTRMFKIWKDTTPALDMGSHLPSELSAYLGLKYPLTLFRVSEHRQVFRCAPRKEVLGYQPITGFADAYPVNILGVASVRALSGWQPAGSKELSARRFRANVVFEGAGAWEEDGWKRVRIRSGAAEEGNGSLARGSRAEAAEENDVKGEGYSYDYHVVCRCVRCKVPNVDLETGVRDRNEPYSTIVKKRGIDKGAKGLGCLGMQMVPVAQEGRVGVGDWVEVLEVGEHEYIKQ